MKNWLKIHYPLFFVLIIAATLRVNLLFVRGTWWFDEMFSVYYSVLPWGTAIKYWFLETNPFLYNLVLRGWINIFGQDETMARIPSLIFGLVTVAFIYYLGYKLISRRAAIVSSLIVSLSGIHLFISAETRTYALFVLLTTLSFYWFIKIFVEQKICRWTWPLFFLTQVLLLYSHLTALAVIIIQILALAYLKTDSQTRKKLLLTQIFSLLLWSVWFIPSFLPKLNAHSLYGWFFTYNTKSSNILTILTSLFVNTGTTEFIFTLFAVVLLGIIFYAIKIFPRQEEKNKKLIFILLLWSLLPALLGAFLGQYVTKYFVFSLSGFALFIAWTLDRIADKALRFIIPVAFLAMLVPSTLTIATTPVFSWYSITEYMEKNETLKSAVLTVPFNEELVVKKYYRGSMPVEGMYPMEDDYSLEERIVRFNWQTLLVDNNKYNQWMEEHTKNREKIFFLQYDDYDSKNVTWFVNRGWRLNKTIVATGHIGITMFEFHAPDYHQTASPTSVRTN